MFQVFPALSFVKIWKILLNKIRETIFQDEGAKLETSNVYHPHMLNDIQRRMGFLRFVSWNVWIIHWPSKEKKISLFKLQRIFISKVLLPCDIFVEKIRNFSMVYYLQKKIFWRAFELYPGFPPLSLKWTEKWNPRSDRGSDEFW